MEKQQSGPWEVAPRANWPTNIMSEPLSVPVIMGRVIVAQVGDRLSIREAEERARLIAAAPDLLDALKKALHALSMMTASAAYIAEEKVDAMDIGFAAIAKATQP